MATPTPAIKLTYADYCNTSGDERYELLDGELVMTPAPGEAHQRASRNLTIMLGQSARESGAGHIYAAPFDIVLSDTNVVQPDLILVSSEREHIITDKNVQGAPDLVVEILSPTTADRDLTIKRDLYARHGVREYWIVDTEAKTVTVLVRGAAGFVELGVCGEGQTLASPTLSGFTISSDEIFEGA